MVHSLEAKLHECLAELTAEEAAQVRGLLMELDRTLPPTVRAKARQFVHGLSPEEAAQLALMAQRADEADAHGFRAAAYEDEDGWKGRPGTNPRNVGKGAVTLPNLGAVLIVAAGAAFHTHVIINGPEYEP